MNNKLIILNIVLVLSVFKTIAQNQISKIEKYPNLKEMVNMLEDNNVQVGVTNCYSSPGFVGYAKCLKIIDLEEGLLDTYTTYLSMDNKKYPRYETHFLIYQDTSIAKKMFKEIKFHFTNDIYNRNVFNCFKGSICFTYKNILIFTSCYRFDFNESVKNIIGYYPIYYIEKMPKSIKKTK